MRSLPRHALVHSDGRRLLVYGELRGSSRRGGAGRSRRRRRDPQAPRRVHGRVGRDRAGAEHAAARLAGDERRPRAVPFLSGRSRGSVLVRGGRLRQPVPVVPARRRRRRRTWTAPTGPAQGRCEVVLYTDRHDASFGELSPTELARVVAIWIDRGRELWADPAHAYVCVFENRGAEVGATIAHPHGQIYALDHVPPVTAAKSEAHRRHRLHERRLPLVRRDASRRPLRPRRLRERELRRGRPLRGEVALRGRGPGAAARAAAPGRPRPRGAARPRRSPCATSRAGTTRSSTSRSRT